MSSFENLWTFIKIIDDQLPKHQRTTHLFPGSPSYLDVVEYLLLVLKNDDEKLSQLRKLKIACDIAMTVKF